MNTFKLPAILIIAPAIIFPFWYYINTDQIATILFGEKLNYCNVLGCEVTRQRFFTGAFVLAVTFVIGLALLFIRMRKSHSK